MPKKQSRRDAGSRPAFQPLEILSPEIPSPSLPVHSPPGSECQLCHMAWKLIEQVGFGNPRVVEKGEIRILRESLEIIESHPLAFV